MPKIRRNNVCRISFEAHSMFVRHSLPPLYCRSITLCRYSYQGEVVAKSLTKAENRNLLQNGTIVLLDRFPARKVRIFFRRYRPWLPTVRSGSLNPAQEDPAQSIG